MRRSNMLFVFLLGCGLFSHSIMALEKSYFDDSGRGWFWYEAPLEKPKQQKRKTVESTTSVLTSQPSARQLLRNEGIQMEEAMAKAQLDPTPHNIREYIERSQFITARAKVFSSAFKDEILFNPQYVTAEHNVSAPIRTIAGNAQNDNLNKKLMSANRHYSLVFFLRSDCPYCHKFSPILKMLADELGYVVLPVSLDGKGLPEFPDARFSPVLVERLNVAKVPSVFLLNPDNNITQPISFGFTGYSEFKEKMSRAMDYVERMQLSGVKG